MMGPQSYSEREELLFLGREVSRTQEYSDETARKIDGEVKRILDECDGKALDLLTANRDKLDLLTNVLMERETLDGRDVAELLEHGRILTGAERNAADAAKASAAGA